MNRHRVDLERARMLQREERSLPDRFRLPRVLAGSRVAVLAAEAVGGGDHRATTDERRRARCGERDTSAERHRLE